MQVKSFVRHILTTLLLSMSPVLLLAGQAATDMSVQQMQVDINSADAATIAAALDGVGLAKAEEIVAHREMYGKFRSLEQLTDVSGIGQATVEKNRHLIVIVTN